MTRANDTHATTHETNTNEPCIEFKNVSFFREGDAVLRNISLQIPAGDYVGVVGPNGSGKTTLIKMMLGLLLPAHGEVRVFGEPPHHFTHAAWIGYVPQHSTQVDSEFPATVEEIVRTGRIAQVGVLRRFTKKDYAAVEDAMATVGIMDLKHRMIGSISGGQRQRVFIARALASEPKMLILDEPTVGVDAASQELFYNFLKMLNEKKGMTIIFVSHDIDVITHEAQHIVCLNRELVCHMPAKEFIHTDHLKSVFGERGRYIAHGH